MAIQHGTRPARIDHRDYDFFKNHPLGAAGAPVFVDEFFADAGLTMPNQNARDVEFSPPTPYMPEGCTDFAQADLATDLTKRIHNPNDLEAVTGANAKGGTDIRTSLEAARKLGWFAAYYNIRASGALDYFDSFRLAQVIGLDAGENRSISWGTPWFPSWENAANRGVAMMPMPTLAELAAVTANINAFPWHNSKLDGWTTKQGTIPLSYRDKSWQGSDVGERGFILFPREVINMVMGISGTVAYTGSILSPVDNPARIDVSTLQWIVSFLRSLLVRYV